MGTVRILACTHACGTGSRRSHDNSCRQNRRSMNDTVLRLLFMSTWEEELEREFVAIIIGISRHEWQRDTSWRLVQSFFNTFF